MKSRFLKLRLLALTTAVYLAASPFVMAADEGGEAAAEPVWARGPL